MSNSSRPHGLQPARLLCPWNSPGKNTGVGSHFLLQGLFLTQGLNLGLLHCRQILYQLSHQGTCCHMPEMDQNGMRTLVLQCHWSDSMFSTVVQLPLPAGICWPQESCWGPRQAASCWRPSLHFPQHEALLAGWATVSLAFGGTWYSEVVWGSFRLVRYFLQGSGSKWAVSSSLVCCVARQVATRIT